MVNHLSLSHLSATKGAAGGIRHPGLVCPCCMELTRTKGFDEITITDYLSSWRCDYKIRTPSFENWKLITASEDFRFWSEDPMTGRLTVLAC